MAEQAQAQAESVNENVDVGVTDDNISEAYSFDDLTSSPSAPAPRVVKPSARPNPLDEKPVRDNLAGGDDAEEEAAKAPRETESNSDEEGAEDAIQLDDELSEESYQRAEGAPEMLKGRQIAGKLGDETVDINTAAVIPVKIDGEMKGVQVQELINNYSGHKAYDQKFTDLSKQREEHLSQLKVVNDKVGQLFGSAKAIGEASGEEKINHAYKTLNLFGELTGQSSYEFMKNLRSAFMEEAKGLAEMDETDRKRYEFEAERRLYDNMQESARQQQEFHEKTRYEQQERAKVQESYSIDSQEYMRLQSELEAGIQSGKDWGTSPQDVVSYSRSVMVRELAEELGPEGAQIPSAFLGELYEYALKWPETTKEDLHDLVKETFGQTSKSSKAAKSVNRRMEKSKVAKPKPKPAPEADLPRVTSSEDLWEVML